jgi:apolipoprotein N-acyltransferase
VLGLNHLLPDPRLTSEAQRRGVAWLFGTEGGAQGGPYLTYNLVRGEVDGRPPFLQAKTEPMPFGERMPGPAWLRTRLDAALDFASQEPGVLTAASAFRLPTPQGELGIHPLLCSEALLPLRVRDGLDLTGAELLTNHTNDGWFERSIATDLHAAQIRLRAAELGLPLVRVTSTGKSGLYREDGTGSLWGEPLSADAWAFALAWQPIQTPARSPWLLRGLVLAFLGLLVAGLRPSRSAAHEP